MSLTQERLKELVHYDPVTGIWTRLVKRSNYDIGDQAGNVGAKGYWVLRIDGQRYRSARLAFLYMTGKWPEHQADHKNRNRLDDRWANLRDRTPKQQSRNRDAPIGKSGVRGVHSYKKRHVARIVDSDGQVIYLGIYDTRQQAAEVHLAAHKRLFGAPDFSMASAYVQGVM